MEDSDIEYLMEALHTNLTAVAEEVGAIEEEKSEDLKTLGTALSGPQARAKALEEGENTEEASVGQRFVESVELSLLIADAADVSQDKLEGRTGRTQPGLKALGDALGGQ